MLDGPALRRLVFSSTLAGLCRLIPLPLVDDWAGDIVRRRQTADLLRRHGVEIDGLALRVLATGWRPEEAGGCVGGCLRLAIVKPVVLIVKKILLRGLRKILYLLAVKDAVDAFSQTLHESYLLEHALRGGWRPPEDPAGRAATGVFALRQAIEDAVGAVDPRPLERLIRADLRRARRRLTGSARRLARQLRKLRGADDARVYDRLEHEGAEQLDDLVDELAGDLAAEQSYFARLESELDSRWPPRAPGEARPMP